MKKFWNKFDKMMDSLDDMMDELPDSINNIETSSYSNITINQSGGSRKKLTIDGHEYVPYGKYWIAKDMLNKDGNIKNV